MASTKKTAAMASTSRARTAAASAQPAPAKAATPVKRSDGSERNHKAALALWGSRETSKRGSPVQVRTVVNALVPQLAEGLRDGGRLAHHVGSRLGWLFKVRADEIYGKPDFFAFLRDVLSLGKSTAYRYARIARFATEEQAAWGEDAVLVAAAIVELVAARPSLRKRLKLTSVPRTISDLLHVELPQPSGKPLRLTGAVTLPALEAAFEALGGKGGPATASRLNAADREVNERLQRAARSDPDLHGTEVSLSRGKGGVRLVLKVPPGANLQRVAAAVSRAVADGVEPDAG